MKLCKLEGKRITTVTLLFDFNVLTVGSGEMAQRLAGLSRGAIPRSTVVPF